MRSRRLGGSTLVVCFVVGGAATAQPADAGTPLAPLKALTEPIAKMTPGKARTDQACGQVDAILKAVKGVPAKPPSGAGTDATGWTGTRLTTIDVAADLVKECKAKDRKAKNRQDKLESADDGLKTLLMMLDGMFDEARPRTMTAPMQKFNAALQKALADRKHKNACKDTAAMKKAHAGLDAAPAGFDGKKWDDKTVAINTFLGDMAQYCDGPDAQGDGNFEGLLGNVHDAFFELVMALPAK